MQPLPSHFTTQGVHFLRLRGNAEDRARQHARALREEIGRGAMPFLAERNSDLLRRVAREAGRSGAGRILRFLHDRIVIPWMARSLPEEWARVARLFEEEGALTRSQFVRAAFQPDGLLKLSNLAVAKRLLEPSDWNALLGAALPGCTSVLARPDITKNGRLLAGRNLDYPAVGRFENHTTVCVHDPAGGDRSIPYVAITSAGAHTAGITSMNREGLVLFTHAHFAGRTARSGIPIAMIGDRVIRESRSVAEAVDIIKQCPRIANWSFAIGSAKTRERATIEMTPTSVEVFEAADPLLVHSNYFRSPALRGVEVSLCGAYAADLRGRFCSVEESIGRTGLPLTPRSIATALGSRVDPFASTERVCGNVPAVVTTVQTAIFEPESQALWVSARGESPTSLGPFLRATLDRLDTSFDAGAVEREDLVDAPGEHYNKAMGAFRDAYMILQIDPADGTSRPRALAKLLEAVGWLPGDGHLRLVSGLVALKSQRFGEALACFQSVRGVSAHLAHVARYYSGACHDLLGERRLALAEYEGARSATDARLASAVRLALRTPFDLRRLASLQFDLQFPDCLRY